MHELSYMDKGKNGSSRTNIISGFHCRKMIEVDHPLHNPLIINIKQTKACLGNRSPSKLIV